MITKRELIDKIKELRASCCSGIATNIYNNVLDEIDKLEPTLSEVIPELRKRMCDYVNCSDSHGEQYPLCDEKYCSQQHIVDKIENDIEAITKIVRGEE